MNSLPTFRIPSGTAIAQTRITTNDSVTLSSPALKVMTDLTQVRAATTQPGLSLRQATPRPAPPQDS